MKEHKGTTKLSPRLVKYWEDMEDVASSDLLNENAKIVLFDYYTTALKKEFGIK